MKEFYLYELFGEFAEDKDKAKELRVSKILPSLNKGEEIVFDFKGVNNATQSFIHALISDLIRKKGVFVLDNIQFKNCNDTIQTIITIVVNYMQDSIDLDDEKDKE
jgi:hypothetical protein